MPTFANGWAKIMALSDRLIRDFTSVSLITNEVESRLYLFLFNELVAHALCPCLYWAFSCGLVASRCR